MTLADFLARFGGRAKRVGDLQWMATCPAHDDCTPSLSIGEGDNGQILLTCHAGCSVEAICAAMKIAVADLFDHTLQAARRIVAEYDYRDERGILLYQTVRYDPKGFSQRRPNGSGGWLWNLSGVRRVIYRLPELRGLEEVVIAAGEKDVNALWALGIPATTNALGESGKWLDGYTQQLVAAGIKRIYIFPDNDLPGQTHAEQVARAFQAAGLAARLVLLPGVPPGGDVSDFVDLHGGRAKEELLKLIRDADVRPQPEMTDPPAAGPRPDGVEMLSGLIEFIRGYVVLSVQQCLAIALWVVHCHAFEAFYTTPYLMITSPLKQSGKTLLLEVLSLLTPKPWLMSRVTPAALVRRVERSKPTLLLDEIDAVFKHVSEFSEALRGMLNSGYRRSGRWSLCEKRVGNWTDIDFSTFCPKAMAAINDLPDTIADRSIPIRIKRRQRCEVIQTFRIKAATSAAAPLKASLEAWAAAHMAHLTDASPIMPSMLRDRARDVWEPLIAIAEVIGGIYPALAREAAIDLSGGAEASGSDSGLELLADLRDVFNELDPATTAVSTQQLVDKLVTLIGRPWRDYRDGKGISASWFAQQMKAFGVLPGGPYWMFEGTKRKQLRGYRRVSFEDAWNRHLPHETSPSSDADGTSPEEPEPVTTL
jgi:hypothetical protein